MTQVTGQSHPGKGKTRVKASFAILALCALIYGGAVGYSKWEAYQRHKESLPVLALNSFVGDLRSFMARQKPLRFPADLAELDSAVWTPRRTPGRPSPQFDDANSTYVSNNYKYLYTRAPGRADVCTLLAAPVGPRREEAQTGTVFVVVTLDTVRIWKGAPMSEGDLAKMHLYGNPTQAQLSALGLVEQPQQTSKR